jgi:hypothetical protein
MLQLLICCLFVPPGDFAQSFEKAQSDIENAWRRVAIVEQEYDMRPVRFLGFVEGYFRISAPNVWQEKGNRGVVDSAWEVLCERFSDDIAVKIFGQTESKSPFVQLRSLNKSQGVLWEHELSGLKPRVVSGPSPIYTDVIIDPKVVYVFGRIGNTEPVRFLRVLSRENGEVVLHFAFVAYLKSNVGRFLSDEELKAVEAEEKTDK